MMLAPVVLVLPQVFDYPVKCPLADLDIGVRGNLFIYGLVCQFFKSFLVPTWAFACLPNQATHIAKLAPTTIKY